MSRKVLKIILPNKIICLVNYSRKFFKSYVYDIRRYLKYSTTMKSPKSIGQLESRIIAHYHIIEKGLSLRETRLGYGENIINSLVELLKKYKLYKYPEDKEAYKSAISALNSYISFHEENNHPMEEFKKTLRMLSNFKNCKYGGIKVFEKREIIKYGKDNFGNMALHRFSIREFSDKPVELKKIIEAIKISQKSPSVCNRQSSRLYIIQDKKMKNQILNLQNGNRGFGHLADKILIVTSDLQSFDSIQERNQAFIDSGIFTMSLLYSLHYKGLGACTLNWCVDIQKDKKLRKIAKINESENIILMIAIGNLPDMIKVTISTRKNINDIIHMR